MVVRNSTILWRTLAVALLSIVITGVAAWMTFGLSTISRSEMTNHKVLNLSDQDETDVRLYICDLERAEMRMGIDHIKESVDEIKVIQKEILKRLPPK